MEVNGRQRQIRLLAVIGLALVCVLGRYLVAAHPPLQMRLRGSPPHPVPISPPVDHHQPEGDALWVHVEGEVVEPGPYRMEDDAVLGDLIDRAGGLTDAGDAERLDLTRRLRAGERVIVPRRAPPGDATAEEADLVDINTADGEQLQTLHGIGPVLARRIIEHRRRHGDFRRAEDLLAVKGIGPVTLENIRHRILIR